MNLEKIAVLVCYILIYLNYNQFSIALLFFCRVKCLLCSLHFIREAPLKKHYLDYHFINEDHIYFKNLFLPGTIDKTRRICRETFETARNKRKHMFLFHYGTDDRQLGGRRPQASMLPLNVLKSGPIT